jgi:hypothetical protein
MKWSSRSIMQQADTYDNNIMAIDNIMIPEMKAGKKVK